jgi:predicted RNA-binding protein with PUA-like domain
MKSGDQVLYYHSGKEKAVVGVATVSKEAFPDPTCAKDDAPGDWIAVQLKPVRPLKRGIPLSELKTAVPTLPLVKQSRLSVSPVSPEEFQKILKLEKG